MLARLARGLGIFALAAAIGFASTALVEHLASPAPVQLTPPNIVPAMEPNTLCRGLDGLTLIRYRTVVGGSGKLPFFAVRNDGVEPVNVHIEVDGVRWNEEPNFMNPPEKDSLRSPDRDLFTIATDGGVFSFQLIRYGSAAFEISVHGTHEKSRTPTILRATYRGEELDPISCYSTTVR